ncbi:MAG TPA: ABC transporter permease [Holophaga sp.]|nr:ABC transporter permease [Holophaga sp.]
MGRLQPVSVICQREFIRFFRVKSRWLGALARPLIWLVLVGNGLNAIVRPQGPYTYLQSIFPGIIAMTIMFSAILSSATIVWDREFGFLREMLVAPVSRGAIVLGKAVAGTLISVLQAMLVLLLAPLLGLPVTAGQAASLLVASLFISFCVTSMGILISACIRTFDGYNLVMNFLVMPLFLLSGAMYPVASMPLPLRLASLCNPVTYCVDVFKHILLGAGKKGPEFLLVQDLAIVAALSALAIALAALAFRRKD